MASILTKENLRDIAPVIVRQTLLIEWSLVKVPKFLNLAETARDLASLRNLGRTAVARWLVMLTLIRR
jgi:hypothetical protein